MLLHTVKPRSIRKIATEVINSLFGNSPFIALHWRYDIGDFGHHCMRDINNGKSRGVCSLLLGGKFNGTRVAENLNEWMQKTYTLEKVNQIYVAAPLKEAAFVEDIKTYFESRNLGQVRYQKDMQEYIAKKFTTCPEDKYLDQIHDFVSQTEQEICLRSRTFIESDGSMWSLSVRQERIIRNIHFKNDIKNRIFWK